MNGLRHWGCGKPWPLRLALLMSVSLPVIACAQATAGRAFEQAESLFRQDPAWLGADGAHSVQLDEGRIFWTFADTFIATSGANDRRESEMVRNSIAIQTGTDPLNASMSFHWRRDSDGSPASFFPEDGDAWYWPQASILLEEGPLITFLSRVVATPGQGLGFRVSGFAIAIIDEPGKPPAEWRPEIRQAAAGAAGALQVTALVREGDHVTGVALLSGQGLAGALLRYSVASLLKAEIGRPQWWGGQARGWVGEDQLGAAGPEIVLDHAGSECSIHRDRHTGSFIHVTTYGFGAATIGMREAPALTGPWSDPVTIYIPPESNGPRPFVYGAVAQPALAGRRPGDLLVTYATNSFEFADLFTVHGAENLYWPRVFEVGPGAR